jgi:hypothetical protein
MSLTNKFLVTLTRGRANYCKSNQRFPRLDKPGLQTTINYTYGNLGTGRSLAGGAPFTHQKLLGGPPFRFCVKSQEILYKASRDIPYS